MEQVKLGTGTNMGGRTIMLDDLTSLLVAVPLAGVSLADYERAVVEENCLAKPTLAARNETWKRLRKVYKLDFADPLYRLFHTLWALNPTCRPLLGFQYAWVYDSVIRDSCRHFLPMPVGAEITPQGTSKWVHETYPDKYSEASVKSVGRSINSSWYQGGYVEGIHDRVRKAVVPQAENVAFALYVGLGTGLAGTGLFQSPMMELLDAPESALIALAEQAARQGILRFKHIGDVIEVAFDNMGGMA